MSVFGFFTTQAKSGSTVGFRMSSWLGRRAVVGRLGRSGVVPAKLNRDAAERLGQSDRCGRMNEPRSNCSERPDLHAGWLQWTDPRTRAHHF
ncbi:hypothetical protein Bca52824_081434 [Brassica carinata]|uniref:Uncharacterized protein n=1 Tax=Brassica carinata TaxID=52824 RepID=A0A8X7PIJ2_BRACI|nr:hypothetical protein Bca52824_081434 [Brassica carinata]